MKTKIILFFFLSIQIIAQNLTLSGLVVDAETKLPLFEANVYISNKIFGTTTKLNGEFFFEGKIDLTDTLVFSYVGYQPFRITVLQFQASKKIISLNKIILPSQTVFVEAAIGTKGYTAASFDIITKADIQKNYVVQDIPEYISKLPSTTFYSENGNGIGYNYLSIRGFDQRRISVSINGIPQNDPEDNNIYWLDFPDLLASTDMIQVQRGAGSGVIGYPAVGGSINILTSSFSNKSSFDLSSSIGSYNTRKYSAAFSSGLIEKKYSFYTKLSQILSSGYRNSSWVKFNSFFFSAVRFDENITTQLNIYGGPIEDGLAYNGIAKFAVKSKEKRKDNFSYWEADANNYTYTLLRRPEEIENFSQPHFELLNEFVLNDKIKLNSALFLVIGKGFFDYDGSWSVYYDDYFRLKQNGFDTNYVPTNALIRAQVENKQFGWIPRVSIKHNNGQLIIGGEFRSHRSDHWGTISYAENLPAGVTKDYQYYFYNGAKNIINGFINESYNLSNQINILGELQFAYHLYKLYNEKYLGTDFTISNLFFNPKIALNYKFNSSINSYISFARVSREPRLKNYYDAAESSGSETPQFELNNDGSYNYSKPLVMPETMNDIELGASYIYRNLSLNINIYFMLFENEIVKNGKLDRFGQPITGNVERTSHLGIESSLQLKFYESFELFANATLGKNKIDEGKYFINDTDVINISGNSISGFPNFLTNIGLSYSNYGVHFSLIAKYVGKFYSDNFDSRIKNYLSEFPHFIDYDDNVNDSYFATDFYGSYSIRLFNGLSDSKLYFQINNIFDNLYSANAIGKEFYPAAERNFIAGIQFGL
jgi:iron complex outermembrane receptor protein